MLSESDKEEQPAGRHGLAFCPRQALTVGVWAGSGIAGLWLLATALWCVLAATGDAAGANVARVLSLFLLILWAGLAWGVIVLLVVRVNGTLAPPTADLEEDGPDALRRL